MEEYMKYLCEHCRTVMTKIDELEAKIFEIEQELEIKQEKTKEEAKKLYTTCTKCNSNKLVYSIGLGSEIHILSKTCMDCHTKEILGKL